MEAALPGMSGADALDVGLIAIVLYGLLRWMRRSEGSLIAVGAAILIASWGVARALDLRLITWAFQGVFAFLAVVIAVLFQEELRGMLERVAAVVLGRADDARPRLDTAGILTEALADLSRRRVGALVLLPGMQPLRRHLRGGVALGGELSVPLLQSLFDPHSDGHDGAIVVENRRVTHFGVQLPLSRDLAKIARLGTRHSAALGLSERTDALCLVVSEERGTISIARAGQLEVVDSPAALQVAIERFYRQRMPLGGRRPFAWRALSEHRAEKAAALAAAASLWLLFVAGAEPVEQQLDVPVRVDNAGQGVRVGPVEPERVTATVRGTRRELWWAMLRGTPARVDAAGAGKGRHDLKVARGPGGAVEVTGYEPASVRVTLAPDVAGEGGS